ncbi:hypothetical protein [Herbiconiux liangxiaofengii]|uniref:hypothetical protein n=1 Tax=Herbiconiux liangxiaofengii TaxID=3342795 RepID=UPI0035B7D32A
MSGQYPAGPPQQPEQQHPQHPQHPHQPSQQADSPARAARNPLGLASLIAGAAVPLIGLIFLVIQAAAVGAGFPAMIGGLSTVQGVLAGLLGLAAVVLGIVAVTRPGLSKTLAAAGIALGASALVSVIGSMLYGVLIQLLYGY